MISAPDTYVFSHYLPFLCLVTPTIQQNLIFLQIGELQPFFHNSHGTSGKSHYSAWFLTLKYISVSLATIIAQQCKLMIHGANLYYQHAETLN
jgi:hypothetical protein